MIGGGNAPSLGRSVTYIFINVIVHNVKIIMIIFFLEIPRIKFKFNSSTLYIANINGHRFFLSLITNYI